MTQDSLLRRAPWITSLLSSAVLAVALCAIGFALHGKTGIEKTLVTLSMPVGLTWLLLSGWIMRQFLSARGGRRAVGDVPQFSMCQLLCVWCLYTLLTTPMLADACMRYLETRETPFDAGMDPPLNVLVVLGGGTRQGPERAQAGSSGDRVVYAAQLYHQGLAQQLITTGSPLPGMPADQRSASEQTVEIWTRLGIPAQAIQTLEGHNTFQEIQSLKRALPSMSGERVGLLTSAWHLPRAMRLARAQGLTTVIPVAADYQMQTTPRSFLEMLPVAGNLTRLAQCQHELLARLVAR